MSLSPRTKECLMDAEGSLRNALVYASRNESPQVISMISQMISGIETINEVDAHAEHMKRIFKRLSQ